MDIFPTDISPSWTISPPVLHGVGYFSPSHHHHPPIYNIKRSTVNVYKLIAVDRLGSGIQIIATFQKFPTS